MPSRSLAALFAASFFALAAMYAPQPLLPLLADWFGVSQTRAATLITWSLLPMGLAPLGAGVLLQRIAPQRVLAGSLAALAVSELAFAVTPSFSLLLALRFVQGALVAASLAAVMTYIALHTARLRRDMSIYVAATIVGGLCGRLAAGFLAARLDWRLVFVVIGVALLLCVIPVVRLPGGPARVAKGLAGGQWRALLRRPILRAVFGVVFAAFFTFTALLNFIPFRLSQLDGDISQAILGFSYVGFLLGLAAALLSGRIADRLGGTWAAVGLGVGALFIALGLASVGALAAVMAAIAAAAAGFFLLHAVLASHLNVLAPRTTAAANSLYVACYYVGGTLGSVLPGLLFTRLGWAAFLFGLLAVMGAGALLVLRGRYLERQPQGLPASP